MGEKHRDNRNHGGNLSKEKTNGGLEKKNVNQDGTPKKQQTPNEEVPNVGDHAKKGPTVEPTYKPKENEDQKETKEEGLGQIVSEDKDNLGEEKPEEQEVVK